MSFAAKAGSSAPWTPPSSAYCSQMSLSISSIAAVKRSNAASPLEMRAFSAFSSFAWARASVAESAPEESAAAAPSVLRNERLSTLPSNGSTVLIIDTPLIALAAAGVNVRASALRRHLPRAHKHGRRRPYSTEGDDPHRLFFDARADKEFAH